MSLPYIVNNIREYEHVFMKRDVAILLRENVGKRKGFHPTIFERVTRNGSNYWIERRIKPWENAVVVSLSRPLMLQALVHGA